MKEVLSVTKLKMHFRRAKECAAVGNYLGDKQLLAVGKSVMAYTQYLAEVKHQTTLDVPIDGEDKAVGLLAHVQSLKQLREKLVRIWKERDSSSNSDREDGGKESKEKIADPDYKLDKIRPKTNEQRSSDVKIVGVSQKTTAEQSERPASREKPGPVKANVSQTEEKRDSSHQEEEGHNETKPSETTKE